MKILAVEDEERLFLVIQKGLAQAGYEVEPAHSAEKALKILKDEVFDLFVIDINLPGMDGLSLCKELRDQGYRTPILILTAQDSTMDKISGLNSGADDYMTKPFEFDEFTARIRALLRKGKGYEKPHFIIDSLVVDPNQRLVKRGEKEIELSRKEYGLLEFLVRNAHKIVTRPMISHSVWDNDSSAFSNIIDVFIATLRKKIDLDNHTKLIHTIRGRGFMLTDTIKESD